MRGGAFLLLLLLEAPLLFVLGCYGANRLVAGDRAIVRTAPRDAPSPPARSSLRLAAFNIAHGRGGRVDATNWGGMTTERRARLERIGHVLAELDLDVVVLNEVDFDAVWSGHVDQAAIIADAAGFAHIARQHNIDASIGVARLRFGNAVLSRHPITRAEIRRLPALGGAENLLLGNHDSVLVHVDVAGLGPVAVWGVHLEVRDECVRIAAVESIIADGDMRAPLFVLGDFNSTPTTFPHAEPCDDTGTTAFETMIASGAFTTFPAAHASPAADHTFPSSAPVRTIDWILAPSTWTLEAGAVVATEESDHRPVWAEFAPPLD